MNKTVEKFGAELTSCVWAALDEAQRSAKENYEDNRDLFKRAGRRESQVRLGKLEPALSTEDARKAYEVERQMFAAAEAPRIDLSRHHAH